MASTSKDSDMESSDEEILNKTKRKRKTNMHLVSSDSEDQDSDLDIKPKKLVKPLACESDDDLDDRNQNSNLLKIKNENASSNDLSDSEQTEKCAICLNKFSDQDVASPETCHHTFCPECLQEWAKKINTCPIDRSRFNYIHIRHRNDEKISKMIYVEYPDCFIVVDSDSSDPTYCEICHNSDNEHRLLLCDECERGFHMNCLIPPLEAIPSGPWFCARCTAHVEFRVQVINSVQDLISRRFRNNAYENNFTNSTIPPVSPTLSSIYTRRWRNYFQRYRSSNLAALLRRKLGQERRNIDIINHSLVSSTGNAVAAVGINSHFFESDDDSDLENSNSSASSSVLNQGSDQNGNANSRFATTSNAENFDLVGSILQSQSILHGRDVILKPDGSLIPSKSNPQNNLTSNSSPIKPNCNQMNTPLQCIIKDEAISLQPTNTHGQQRPQNPAQKSAMNYTDASKQIVTYACTSSINTMSSSTNYNMIDLPRSSIGSDGNTNWNNNFYFSHKNNPSSLPSDEIKKILHNPTNMKETLKTHQSEDEVDIYSDIESLGDDDNSLNMQIASTNFKCEESHPSATSNVSDSSDNELVIDEDIRGDEENEKTKINISSKINKNISMIESEGSNPSSTENFEQDYSNKDDHTLQNNSINQNSFTRVDDVSQEACGSEISSFLPDSENKAERKLQENPRISNQESDLENDDENSNISKRSSKMGDECSSPIVKSLDESNVEMESQCDNSFSSENGLSLANFSKKIENSCETRLSNENSIYSNDHLGENDNSSQSFKGSFQNLPISESEDYDDASKENSHYDDVSKENSQQYMKNTSFGFSKQANNCNFEGIESLQTDSTQCLDEKNDDVDSEDFESINQSLKSLISRNFKNEYNDELSKINNEEKNKKDMQNESNKTKDVFDKIDSNFHDNISKTSKINSINDLGIEDISEAGSEDMNDNFIDANERENPNSFDREKYNEYKANQNDYDDNYVKDSSRHISEFNQNNSHGHHTKRLLDDQEEGEIVEDKASHKRHKHYEIKNERIKEDNEESADFTPRMNIADLPRIPKIKRDKEKPPVQEEIKINEKRVSVLSKVDSGGTDISWKRLSKHTRERSYRDGRPKDEKLLYREKELKAKEKTIAIERKTEKPRETELIRDDKRHDCDKSKISQESHSRDRKSEKFKDSEKKQISEWNLNNYDKHIKSHSEKYKDKEKHFKDKKDKDRYDNKNKYNDEEKYERQKVKDTDWYERDARCARDEERFEKVKFKDKEHKSKHKERKNENSKTNVKEHSREKHKHSYSIDHLADKKAEREVRKIDDKIKIVVEHKENSKNKVVKYKNKKEIKTFRKSHENYYNEYDTKQNEINDYSELTSIESKEVFAKGDSIIINVNFNRGVSPKESTLLDKCDTSSKERKIDSESNFEEHLLNADEIKTKSKIDEPIIKRPTTPPEINVEMDSIEESYWQENEESNNKSPTSDNPKENLENSQEDSIDSTSAYEVEECSDNSNHSDLPFSLTDKEGIHNPSSPENIKPSNFSKDEDNFNLVCKKSSRSPSPPSPFDNDSYDPCEPTKSPSLPSSPPEPPLPTTNPQPPPSPELPPLPPEPEPIDIPREDPRTHKQNPSEFIAVSTNINTSINQPIILQTQASVTTSLSLPNIMLPPPNFLTSAGNNMLTISSLLPPRNFNFQVNSTSNMLFPPNHAQQVIRGNFMSSQMQPPNIPHISNNPTRHLSNISTIPHIPNPTNVAHLSNISTLPHIPNLAQMSNAPNLPQMSNIPNIAQIPNASNVQHVMNVSNIPQIPNPPNVPQLSKPPNVPQHHPPNISQIPNPHNVSQVSNPPTISHLSNPPVSHMNSIPPPPAPSLSLMPQVHHGQMNVRPPLRPNTLIQNMALTHNVNMSQMHLAHIQHPPSTLSNTIPSQSSLMVPPQNQSNNIPISIHNQTSSQNLIQNNALSTPNQNLTPNKSQVSSSSQLPPQNQTTVSIANKNDKQQPKHSSPIEKNEVIDMDVDSPYSPGDSPSMDSICDYSPTCSPILPSPKGKDVFDTLLPSEQKITEKKLQDTVSKGEKSKSRTELKAFTDMTVKKSKHDSKNESSNKVKHAVRMQLTDKHLRKDHKQIEKKEISKFDDSQLRILDELPSSAVEMQVKEKFLKKLNRQERVVEEVKLALKPYYKSRNVTKEEYKNILRKSVPKICHNKSGEINPLKVKSLVECYVKKIKHARKKAERRKSKFS